MKKIALFSNHKLSKLEDDVNAFLDDKKYDEVIDIQMIRRGDIEAIILVTYRDAGTD